MADLKDKVVLITGSSAGIGEGTAVHLAKLGAKLTLTGRSKEKLLKVVEKCKSAGLDEDKILFLEGDIASQSVRESLITKTKEKFGHLDILVNNAGLVHYGGSITTTEEKYDEIMDVNLKSVFFLTKLAIPLLKETKGNIINMSSVAAYAPIMESSAYCMSKAALDMYTKCLSLELAQSGVRVNAIAPGPVVSEIATRGNTPFTDPEVYKKAMEDYSVKVPLQRVGYPEDVAKAVAFLASNEQASFITGDTMYIDGCVRFICSNDGRSRQGKETK